MQLSVHHPQGEQHLEGGSVWGQSEDTAQAPLSESLAFTPEHLQPENGCKMLDTTPDRHME